MGFYPDKVFPEEVDNIKEFMRDTFTTNVNAFSLSSGEKIKGDLTSDFNNPANFLQEEEISTGSDYYNNPELGMRGGIDSASLNRRYLNANQRRMPKNYFDENDNYMMGEIARREKNDNFDNNNNNNDSNNENENKREANYNRNFKISSKAASEDKANLKNHEISFLMQKNIEKSQANKAPSADNANKNNDAVVKENNKSDVVVNNHKMLRKLN